MTVFRAFFRQIFPQREAALVNGVAIHHGGLGHAALRGVLRHGAIGEKYEIIFSNRNDGFFAAFPDMQGGYGFVIALNADIHVCDRAAGDEADAVVGKIFFQRTNQVVVLIVFRAQK